MIYPNRIKKIKLKKNSDIDVRGINSQIMRALASLTTKHRMTVNVSVCDEADADIHVEYIGIGIIEDTEYEKPLKAIKDRLKKYGKIEGDQDEKTTEDVADGAGLLRSDDRSVVVDEQSSICP